MDATEEARGPRQRKEAPMPAAVLTAWGTPRADLPGGLTGWPNSQRANTPANRPPDIATSKSSEAPEADQPGTGPEGPTPDAEHASGPPPLTAREAQTAGHAGAAPSTARAHHSDTGAPGDATSREAPTRGPPHTHAESESRATTADTPKRAADRGTSPGRHTGDEHYFDAFT